MINEPCPVFRSTVTLKSYIERTGAKRIVLANGCFDPLHVGHIRYLCGAKEQGDFLVVALSDDKSTRALKGKNRPVMPAADRSKLIAALEMVDAVLIFSARNASRVLKSLQPDLHAKGTDYTDETAPERDVSTALGIDTVIVGDPTWPVSSDVVKRIQRSKDRRGGDSGVKTGLEARAVEELSVGGRILVTRLQYLGDVILTLPAVYAIRERFPDAEIDYLSRDDGADILSGEPVFDRVFRLTEKSGVTWRLASEMRRRSYSVAVDFYSNPRSALLTWLSGARVRIGGARRIRRHLYTHPTTTPTTIRSAIDHHMYYLSPIGIEGEARKPTLTLSETERIRARERLERMGVEPFSGTRVGLHPGGKWEVKRWPIENFADLARRLVARDGVQVVVLVGPGEERYRDALRSRLGDEAVYLPTLPIRETAAVIDALDGLVVGDGGIMHTSVAVGTPTVGIFGASEPFIWFPYESFGPYVAAYAPIECRPCHRHDCDHLSCLQQLPVETVERKLLDVLETERGVSPS